MSLLPDPNSYPKNYPISTGRPPARRRLADESLFRMLNPSPDADSARVRNPEIINHRARRIVDGVYFQKELSSPDSVIVSRIINWSIAR